MTKDKTEIISKLFSIENSVLDSSRYESEINRLKTKDLDYFLREDKDYSLNQHNLEKWKKISQFFIHLGYFRKGILILKSILNLNPSNPKDLEELGIAYYKDGDLEKSIKFLEKSITIGISSEKALLWLANACKIQGQINKAINYFERLVKIDSKHNEGYRELFYIYYEKMDLVNAVASLRRIFKINPKETTILITLFDVLWNDKSTREEIKEEVSQILKENPDHFSDFLYIVKKYKDERKPNISIEILKGMMHLYPNNMKIVDLLYKSSVDCHNYEGAIDALFQKIALQGGIPKNQNGIKITSINSQAISIAIEASEKILEIIPMQSPNWNRLIDLLIILKGIKGAIADLDDFYKSVYKNIIKEDPYHFRRNYQVKFNEALNKLYALAQLHFIEENYYAALDVYNVLLIMRSNDRFFWSKFLSIINKLEDDDCLFELYDKYINTIYRNNKDRIVRAHEWNLPAEIIRKDNEVRYFRFLEFASKIHHKNEQLWYKLHEHYEIEGREEKFLPVIKNILRIRPNDLNFWEKLTKIYKDGEREQELNELIEEIIQIHKNNNYFVRSTINSLYLNKLFKIALKLCESYLKIYPSDNYFIAFRRKLNAKLYGTMV